MSTVSTEFQVALLMSDIVEAKKVSDELREMGIFAHYYNALDEFWLSLNASTPDLCIVDVTLMSQGTLLFKSHPKVKNHELKYCFYYKESTTPLLNSTFGSNHYGLVRAEISLTEQLKSVFKRRNEELRLRDEKKDLETRLERLKIRGKRLSEVQAFDHHKSGQHNQLLELMRKFGSVTSPNEFMNRLIYSFENWSACKSFGIYHLNRSGQKLISPKIKKNKYKMLPDVWLASDNDNGISNHASSMAHDVSYGLIEGELTEIKVHGNKENPDVLILADFDQEQVKEFEWSLLELKLNSEYRSSLIEFYKRDTEEKFFETIFKTFERMDDIQFHKVESEHKFVLVDFSKLTQFTSTQNSNRFHWNTFYNEFVAELASLLNSKLKVSSLSCDKFIISLDRKNIDTEVQKLKSYVADLELWRYFEDSTAFLSNDLDPLVKFINPSSVNTIRMIEDSSLDFMHGEQGPKTRGGASLEA